MISRFDNLRLVQLSLMNVGPFRKETRKFPFMGTLGIDAEGKPKGEAPANLYMLFAMNGMGKTTILHAIYSLMQYTGGEGIKDAKGAVFGVGSRAQLDLKMTLTIDNTTRVTLVSLWYGSQEPLVEWNNQEIDSVANAEAWAKIGFLSRDGETVTSPETNPLGKEILKQIRYGIGTRPTKLFGLSSSLPSVIYFPANRAVVSPVAPKAIEYPRRWGYQPARIFEADGPAWEYSVDSVLMWLEWLNDERIDDLLDYINRHLFMDGKKFIQRPKRDTLLAMVSSKGGTHPLDALSHGERALLQLYVRTLCHMTKNTVILVDEIEIHLHTKWMNRFFIALKSLIQDAPDLSVFFTTHNRELMRAFDHTLVEKGLVKGGYLIEEDID